MPARRAPLDVRRTEAVVSDPLPFNLSLDPELEVDTVPGTAPPSPPKRLDV